MKGEKRLIVPKNKNGEVTQLECNRSPGSCYLAVLFHNTEQRRPPPPSWLSWFDTQSTPSTAAGDDAVRTPFKHNGYLLQVIWKDLQLTLAPDATYIPLKLKICPTRTDKEGESDAHFVAIALWAVPKDGETDDKVIAARLIGGMEEWPSSRNTALFMARPTE